MQYIKILISISLCFGLVSLPISAQNDKKHADELFKDLGYQSAIKIYEKESHLDFNEMSNLANAYRLNHDTENAEFWYSQIIHSTKNPKDLLYYAQALQSNGRFEMAKSYYLQYDELIGGPEAMDQRGRLLAEAIDRMNEFGHTETKIKNETLINSGKIDFSPTYYQGGIIFASNRGVKGKKGEKSKDVWSDDNFIDLFYADKNQNGSLVNARLFSLDLTTRYHEGPICFSKNEERIYFTRNDYVDEKRRNTKNGFMKLQIYTATKNDEGWSAPVELPFNTLEYNEAHPAISPDRTKFYFSSDRPGGFGGMDLYVSKFKDGKWERPENLGPKVNTAGNETFPFIHDDGTMYFASDGWGGLGGLDIFSTEAINDTTWLDVVNMGTPFNSPKDDFGLILNILKTEGYLSSARQNGTGKDDIYSFTMPSRLPVKVEICAYEKNTDLPLNDVQFEIIEQNPETTTAGIYTHDISMVLEKIDQSNEYLLKFKQRGYEVSNNDIVKIHNTNKDGVFDAYFKENKNYLLIATKDGYKLAEEKFEGNLLKGKKDYSFCVQLEKLNCMNLNGIVQHKKYGNEIEGATVTMTNLCTGEELQVVSDRTGRFVFPCVKCGCEFKFKGQKTNFKEGFATQNTIDGNCKLGSSLSTVILLDNDIEQPKTIFADVKLEEGATIELKNIYYDFDKYDIRDDAKEELNRVVELLKIYPGMIIELASYTDARASFQYNKRLSQNRANAAVEYIVAQGIPAARLVAQGYGEHMLKNHCGNYVDCTEEEHQLNRRTEIKILRFANKEVNVKYIDNKPESIGPANPKRKIRY